VRERPHGECGAGGRLGAWRLGVARIRLGSERRAERVLPGGSGATSPETTSVAEVAVASSAASQSAQAAAKAPVSPTNQSNLQALVAQLNKYLNDSGRPDQYRVDPQSGSMIQEINPANGAVIAEFAASEFPALARSVGASGLLVDSLA